MNSALITLVHNVSEILPRGGRIFYADVTWLLFSDSMESLNEKMGKILFFAWKKTMWPSIVIRIQPERAI